MNASELSDRITYGIRDLQGVTPGTPEYDFAYWNVVAQAMRASQFVMRWSYVSPTSNPNENPGLGKFTMDSETIRVNTLGLDNLDWTRALSALRLEGHGFLILYLTEQPLIQIQVDVLSITVKTYDDGQKFAVIRISNLSGSVPFMIGHDVSFAFLTTQGGFTTVGGSGSSSISAPATNAF